MKINTSRDYAPVHPCEVYRFPGLAIDVCAAWRIIAALSNEERAKRASALRIPKATLDIHWVDTTKAMDADLTIPVLVGSFISRRDGVTVQTQVIDGYHRCYKADQLRKRLVPAFRLTVAETTACRIDDGFNWRIAMPKGVK